jgi:hypothetical protein
MTNNISLEDIKKRVTEKTDSLSLFQHILEASTNYPFGVLIRNGGKTTRLSDGQYESFMAKAESVLTREHFPHLYRKDGYRLRPHGGGFLIPIGKSHNVKAIIHSLCQINNEHNLGLKIEKSKDGPCDDGRNVITEWKLLPPDINEDNAERYFNDFGTLILPVVETKKSLFVTFSNIFDTLPLLSTINPRLHIGSRWFTVFNNRPTICRFVSSLICSNCQLQGHHSSKCPEGLAEITKQIRKMAFKPKASKSSSKNDRNQNDGITGAEEKSFKNNANRRIPKSKKNITPRDSQVDSNKKVNQKFQKTRDGASVIKKLEEKSSGFLHELLPSFSNSKDTGSALRNSMDTLVDFPGKDSIKRQEIFGDNSIGDVIVGGSLPMTIDENF